MAALIKVDTTKIVAGVLARIPTKADTARVLRVLGDAAYNHWRNLAQRNLKMTAQEYKDGLRWDVGEDKATVVLTGVLPNLIEQGFSGGDMRGWMFGGPRAKTAKAGHKYLTVPFRHGTPGTSGKRVGEPMPVSIHQAALKLKATVSRPKDPIGRHGGQTVLYGQRLHADLPHIGRVAKRVLHSRVVGKYHYQPWHSASIYEGMIRTRKFYGRVSQTGGYMTFRVLSQAVIRGERTKEGKAAQHWYHPGIRARRFAQDTSRYIKKIAAGAFAQGMQHG